MTYEELKGTKKMKKLIVLTLVAVMALTMMVGCGAEEPAAEEATQAPATEAPAEEAPAAEELSGTCLLYTSRCV